MRRVGLWILVLSAVLLAAPPAGATEEITACDQKPIGNGATVVPDPQAVLDPGARPNLCWDFQEGEAVGIYSPSITVPAGHQAYFTFWPNEDAEGASIAQVNLRRCIGGFRDPTNPQRSCIKVTDAPFAGAGGSPGTQTASVLLTAGVYVCEITTKSTAEDARCAFELVK